MKAISTTTQILSQLGIPNWPNLSSSFKFHEPSLPTVLSNFIVIKEYGFLDISAKSLYYREMPCSEVNASVSKIYCYKNFIFLLNYSLIYCVNRERLWKWCARKTKSVELYFYYGCTQNIHTQQHQSFWYININSLNCQNYYRSVYYFKTSKRVKTPTMRTFSESLYKKKKTAIRFLSIWIKESTNFMHLRIKIISRMFQKVASVNLRTSLKLSTISAVWLF